jgi:hypothetical protein
VGTLLEQLRGWDLPSLHSFSLDNGISIQEPQNLVEFFKHHGSKLVLLDLNLKNSIDISLILDLCPSLHTFAFNADRRVTSHTSQNNITIVNRPHQHISIIGLHGLSYAFGVGIRYSYAMMDHSFEATYITRSNDLNFAALNKYDFPKLCCIRVVNRGMLEDLNTSNGPSTESGGYTRWSEWCSICENTGIRLEDCTGQLLGTLPENDDAEEGEDGDEEGVGGDKDGEESEDGQDDSS